MENNTDKSELTQWWLLHPNEGWKPVPPCDACDGLVIFGRKVRLGCPALKGTVNYDNLNWVIESAFWAARFKGISSEIRISNLIQTLCDKMRYALDDEMKEYARDHVLIMLDHEMVLDEQIAALRGTL